MRLVRQLAEYTISLKELEDNLLARLAASQARREWGWSWHSILLGWCFLSTKALALYTHSRAP